MTLTTKFDSYIPNDNQDIVVEDLEHIHNTIHAEIANRGDDLDTNWSGADWSGTKQPRGIIYGMALTINTGASRIDAGAGIGRVNGQRAVLAGTENIAFAGLVLNDYIVARVASADGTSKTNPITGAADNTRRVYTTTLVNTASPSSSTDVILGRVTAINGGIPTLGAMASLTYTESGNTLKIEAQSAAADLYGPEGNKHYIRFYAKPSQGLSAVLTSAPESSGFRYLVVNLACNSSGTPTSTLTEIINAINTSASTYYKASLTGTGTFVPTLLHVTYASQTPLAGGTDYTTKIQMITGSSALLKNTQFNVNDPYTKHLSYKGTGTPTTGNPHGTSLADLGISEVDTELHIRREHYRFASIPKISTSNFLKTTINNTQITISKGTTGDLALIAGNITTVALDYSLNDPSSSFRLYYFYLTDTGTIGSRYVATYDSSTAVPGYGSIQNGDHAVISIIRTPKELTGSKVLRLVVSGTGTVFTAYLGSGTGINVTDNSKSYILKDTDGSWIEIWRETEAMVDGDYRNTVTFQTWNDESELPASFAFWKGDQDEWGYDGVNERYIDLRKYGSFDTLNELNNAGSGASPVRFSTFEQSDYLYYVGTTMDLKVAAFEIEFKGTRYRNSSTQTLTLTSDAVHYIVASFSHVTMTITAEATESLATFSNRDAVVIGRVTTNGTNITGVYPVWIRNNYIRSQDAITFDICTETDLWAAIKTYQTLRTATKIPQQIINIRADIAVNMDNAAQYGLSTINLGNTWIYGYGHKLTLTGTTGVFTLNNECWIYDTRFSYNKLMFSTSVYNLHLNNCAITQAAATEFISGTTGKIYLTGCRLVNNTKLKMTSVDGIVYFNNCYIDGQITGKASIVASGTYFIRAIVDYDATTTDFKIICDGCTLNANLYLVSGIYGRSQYNNCTFNDSDIALDDSNNYLLVDNCIFDYESQISMLGKALISNSVFFGDNSLDYIVTGAGTFEIVNCIIPQVNFNSATAKVFMSNCVIGYTIKTLTSNLYLKNIDWLNLWQADALVGWNGTDGMNIYADGINAYNQSTGGFVKDITVGTSGTVNVYLSNSDFRRDSYYLINTGLLVVRFNILNSKFWNWGYQLPTGTTTGLFNAVNSDLQDIRYHINTNTEKKNNLINYVNCVLRWNAQRAYNGAATISHDKCKIITSHLDNYSASNANIALRFSNMTIADIQFNLNPTGTPDIDLYYDNVQLDNHYLYFYGITDLNVFWNNVRTSGTTRFNLANFVDGNVEINNSKLVCTSAIFITGLNNNASGELNIGINNSKVAMTTSLIDMSTGSSAETRINLNNCGGITDYFGSVVVGANEYSTINIDNCDITYGILLAKFININNTRMVVDKLIYGATNAYTTMDVKISNSRIVGSAQKLIDLSTATALTMFNLRTVNTTISNNASLFDVSAAFPATLRWTGSNTEMNIQSNNVFSRTYDNQLDIELYLDNCILNNAIINQGNGALSGMLNGCTLTESNVLIKNSITNKLVNYTLEIDNCIVTLTQTTEEYKYLIVAEWQDNITNCIFKPVINNTRFNGYCGAQASFKGGGLIGFHFTADQTANFTYNGNIKINNCKMYLTSNADMSGNEWAILRYSFGGTATGVIKYFNGGLDIDGVEIECAAGIPSVNIASFVRGPVGTTAFTIALGTAVLSVNPNQFILSNLHMKRGKTSVLALTITKPDTNYNNFTIINHVTHTPVTDEKGLTLTYVNNHDNAQINISNLINPRLTGVIYPVLNYIELLGAGNSLNLHGCEGFRWDLRLTGLITVANINKMTCTNMQSTGGSMFLITNGTAASNLVMISCVIARFTANNNANLVVTGVTTYKRLVIDNIILEGSAAANPDNNVATVTRGDAIGIANF